MASSDQPSWEPSEERRELGEALRRLLDVVVQTPASPAELGAAAAAIDAVTQRLAGQPVEVGLGMQACYREQMSLVGGRSHPIAPQLQMTVGPDGGQGVVVVGAAFQGGPGLVHGGIVALLIDHAMGCVAAGPQRPAMTVRLALRYRRPTPLGVPLTVSVRLDRIEGRQLHLSATITADDVVTVEAEAIFLMLTEQNLQAVFGSAR